MYLLLYSLMKFQNRLLKTSLTQKETERNCPCPLPTYFQNLFLHVLLNYFVLVLNNYFPTSFHTWTSKVFGPIIVVYRSISTCRRWWNSSKRICSECCEWQQSLSKTMTKRRLYARVMTRWRRFYTTAVAVSYIYDTHALL